MAGGAAGIFVGHPWDTVRIRLQVHSAAIAEVSHAVNQQHLEHLYKSTNLSGSRTSVLSYSSILRGTIRKEGLLSLYRGLAAPLLGEMANNCILFGVYGGFLHPLFANSRFAQEHLPTWGTDFLSGSLAGLCISFIVQPSELIKIRLQVDTTHLHELQEGKRGFIDCAKYVYKTEGGLRKGLFSGYSATLTRELAFNGIYFAAYEGSKRYFRNYYNLQPGQENAVMLLTSGGIAGTVAWGISYPTDVVKSIMQADESKNKMTLRECWRYCYRNNTLWKGLIPTLIRAYPVNAVTFWVYEQAKYLLCG